LTSKINQYFERIKTLTSEINEKNDEIKDIYKTAKADNIHVKVLKRLVWDDKMDPHELAVHNHTYEQYKLDLGLGN
jgi:uncharacterized protein (UPF0335 family)